MNDLRECPFCGGDAKLIPCETEFGDFSCVQCDDCDAQIIGKNCVERWNNRAPEQQGRLC